MAIANDIEKLCEDIIGSYDVRIKALGQSAADVKKTLKGFKIDRGKMKAEQAKELGDFVTGLTTDVGNMLGIFQSDHKVMADDLEKNFAKSKEERLKSEAERIKSFKAIMGGIQKDVRDIQTYVKKQLLEFNTAHSDMSEKQWKELSQFANQIANKTKNMLANFEKEHKAMAADLRKNLADSKEERLKSEAERIKSFKVAMDGIQKDVKDIETYIRDYLREFNKSHSDMSAKQKRDLSVFMNNLVSNTGDLLKGFAEENKKMAASWREMAAIMAKNRGLGSIVSAASEVMTVKEAIAPKPAAKKAAPKPAAKKAAPKPAAKKPAPKPAAKKAAPKPAAEKPAPKPIAWKPAFKPISPKPAPKPIIPKPAARPPFSGPKM